MCVVAGTGKIVREGKVASKPEALAAWFTGAAGLLAILIETRHVKAALKATTRAAQLMRMGWFRPVHVKTLPADSEGSRSQIRDDVAQGAEKLGIGGDDLHRLGRRSKQDVVDDCLVLQRDASDQRRYGKHDMEVRNRQQLALAVGEPLARARPWHFGQCRLRQEL
jgi:hypothetical protein